MTASTRANEFVTDTMGLVLHLEGRRLPPAIRSIYESADRGEAIVHVPAIVLAEILYLHERRRISVSLSTVAEFIDAHSTYREQPLDLRVLRSAGEITDVRELHDRLIAGAARLLDLSLITNDPAIQASAYVRTIW